ncbi:MAG: hypothetical protein EBU62_16010, partial [Proteobacteria bacterium]|nr:hypothetical protein [Pseudomonadota bacterium]
MPPADANLTRAPVPRRRSRPGVGEAHRTLMERWWLIGGDLRTRPRPPHLMKIRFALLRASVTDDLPSDDG